MTRFRPLTSVLVALALGAAVAHAAAAKAPPPFVGYVRTVSDADTIVVTRVDDRTSVVVRVRYIDSPEVAHNSKEVSQPWGDEATAYVEWWWSGKWVRVVPSGTSYARIVATVDLLTELDGYKTIQHQGHKEVPEITSLALDLATNGYGQLDPQYKPPKVLTDAEAIAKKEDRGLWSGDEEPIPPWTWRKMTRAAQIEARKK